MREPIRILHVLGRLDRGGAETMVMNLYRHMDRQQVQFDFVLHTAEECSYTQEVLQMGGRIYAVPSYAPKTAGKYRRAWRQFLKEHNEYRILHSHVRSTASLYLPLAKKYGMTTIIHSHNTSSGKGLAAVVKTMLQYPLRFQADYLFACGREAGEWLYGKRACRSQRFVILPNAIDLTQFQYCDAVRKSVRQKLGIADDILLVGHIGRFEPQKNHTFLIEVFTALQKMRPDSALLLIGEGPLEEQVRSMAEQKQAAGAIRFLGRRSDVEELLQAMDVFLFPSLYEGLPVTLIEAQTTGLAIVMSDHVSDEVILTDLVDQLSLQYSQEQWARAVLDAAAKQQRRRSRIEESKAGGYDIADTAKWLMEFYTEKA